MALYVQEIDDDRTMTRPDGQPIAHILVLDHAILSADNLDELVGGLIPGYIASPDRQALRTAFADIVSSQVQES